MRKNRCKQVCSTALTPHCVVTLVVRFAVVIPISQFSSNASGETLFCLVYEIEIIFTCSSDDDLKESILTCGLGVRVVVFGQSFMHSGLGVGVLVFSLGGRGTLKLTNYQLGLFLVLISPFQFVI